MNEIKQLFRVFFITLCMFIATKSAFAQEMPTQTNVPANKEWLITFSSFVDEQSLRNAIQLTDHNGEQWIPNLKFAENGTEVYVLPPANGYIEGGGYTLTVTDAARSMYGEQLQEQTNIHFTIDEEEQTNIVVNKGVKDAKNIQLAEGQSYISFGEPEQAAETFIIPTTYRVGDIVKMEPNDTFKAGFIRKIVNITEKNGVLYAETIFPTLDEAFEQVSVHTALDFQSENLIDMELADRVTLNETNVGSGWDFALIDYLTTVEQTVYGITGSIRLSDVTLDFDFNKESLKNGPHTIALNGTMVASVTMKPQLEKQLGKYYVELLQKEKKLGKFTYALPYGFTVELQAGFVLRPSVIIGAEVAYTNTTDFTLGGLYKNQEFSKILDFDTRNDKATTLKGGIEVKFGPRLTIEVGYLTMGFVDLHNDFGAYKNSEKYIDLQSEFDTCLRNEIGLFYEMLLEIPALRSFKLKNPIGLFEEKVPFISYNDCERITSIQFSNNRLELQAGKKYDTHVEGQWRDLVTAQTKKRNMTEEVTYTTNDVRVHVSKDGEIVAKAASNAYTAIVTATYLQNGTKFTDTLTVYVKATEVDVPAFIRELEQTATPYGYDVMTIDSYRLTNRHVHEVIAVYSRYANQELTSKVHVYTYNEQSGVWERTYDETFYDVLYDVYAVSDIIQNGREQVAIGGIVGAMGRGFAFMLLGSKDGRTVEELVDENDAYYAYGELTMNDNALRVCEISQGTEITWDGKQFQKKRVVCQPDPASFKDGDIIIRYSIDEAGKITSNYPNNAVLKMKKGNQVHLVRQNVGMIEGIFADDTTITIVPDYYNTEDAYTYTIEYVN